MPSFDIDSPLSEPANYLTSPKSTRAAAANGLYAPSEGDASVAEVQAESLVGAINDDDGDESDVVSYYPRRKRTSLFADLSEAKMDMARSSAMNTTAKPRHQRATLGAGGKGVLVGWWRESPAPTLDDRHAVIGFIDVRDRLRTRIQTTNVSGDHINDRWPLPPGPGGSWVTFENIHFFDYLVGLDHFQVKEFVRLRAGIGGETDDEREENIRIATEAAIKNGREAALLDKSTIPPHIAAGAVFGQISGSSRVEKRRRTSSGFVAVNGEQEETEEVDSTPLDGPLDPLYGTRPTRIRIGRWKGSSAKRLEDKHAIAGILGQNDIFRVKILRETRDGRFLDGNFPAGPGALWVQYDDVILDTPLEKLTKHEVKEYCRVRQHQLDQGEQPEEEEENIVKAVALARVRGVPASLHSSGYFSKSIPPAQMHSPSINSQRDMSVDNERQFRRQSSRTEMYAETGFSFVEPEDRGPISPADAAGRAQNLARREMARAEAAQSRADRYATQRDDSSASTPTGSRGPLHESEEMQRLNQLWARQESARMKATGADDAKLHDGVKYERKKTGPFSGKLVSQGTIITIDGEDYVEYRVLTKPSFF